jgi:hypothetical protein
VTGFLQLAAAPLPVVVEVLRARLVRYPPDVVAGLPIPATAKHVLTDIGLPHRGDFFTAADQPRMVAAGRCRIGRDQATDICLDAAGHVVSTSESGEYPDRFVNSDLASFLRFLALVTAHRAAYAARPDDEMDAHVDVLAGALAGADSEAFADPGNWWSLVFEQMRAGLL